MISFLRQGPKLIVFGTNKLDDLMDFLKNNVSGVVTDINNALEIADEDNTVVILTDADKNAERLEDIRAVVAVQMPSDSLFSTIISLGASHLLAYSRVASGIIIMRNVGDFDKLLQSINKTYQGQIQPFFQCLDCGNSNQTIISFTDKPLNEKIKFEDIRKESILVNVGKNQLLKKLRNQTLRFMNESLVGVEWYDLQIRIYDRYSEYKLHYDRLSLILDNMDTGLVLGESWAKDYPRFLMSVLVYQIRLFTLSNPIDIKKILLGLEHLSDGTRIVDYDLFFKNKKIDWPQAITKETKGLDRHELGKIYREKIIKDLSNEDKEKMFKLEEAILKTRV